MTRRYGIIGTGMMGQEHIRNHQDLHGILRHHLDPLAALATWSPDDARLPAADWLAVTDFLGLEDRREMDRLRARLDVRPMSLTELELDDLVAFLHALTGSASIRGRLGIPDRVPSGLAVDR